MQGILVPRETVEEGLPIEGGRLDDPVGFAIGRLVGGRRTRIAAEASLASQEHRATRPEQRGSVVESGLALEDRHRPGSLVPDVGHPGLLLHHGTGRNGAMEQDLLFAVHQHHRVDLESLHVEHPSQSGHRGNGGEAGQDLEARLVGVLELLRIGGRCPRPDPEVVEDHRVLVPFGAPGGKLCSQCLVEVYGHVPS